MWQTVRRRGCRQEGSGRARSLARALLNWFCQGQPWGRCRVKRRALRVSRPARGEEASPEGLGGRHRLAQTDASGPAGQVVGHHLDGHPSGVSWEASRGEMVEAHAVLQVADGVLDLGVAAMVGLKVQGVALSIGDEGVIAVRSKQGQLGATLCPCPGRAEVTSW